MKNTRVPKLYKEINCKKPCSLRCIRLTNQLTTDVVYTGGVGCLRLRLLNWRLAYHVFFLNVWNGQHCNVYHNIKWTFWKKKKKKGRSERKKKVILAKGKNKSLFAKSVRYLMVLIFAIKGNNFRDKWGWTWSHFNKGNKNRKTRKITCMSGSQPFVVIAQKFL